MEKTYKTLISLCGKILDQFKIDKRIYSAEDIAQECFLEVNSLERINSKLVVDICRRIAKEELKTVRFDGQFTLNQPQSSIFTQNVVCKKCNNVLPSQSFRIMKNGSRQYINYMCLDCEAKYKYNWMKNKMSIPEIREKILEKNRNLMNKLYHEKLKFDNEFIEKNREKSSKYYSIKKEDKEFRESNNQKSRERYHQKKNDPLVILKTKEKSKRLYDKKKYDPEFIMKNREKSRLNREKAKLKNQQELKNII